jgi:hypothetical protein
MYISIAIFRMISGRRMWATRGFSMLFSGKEPWHNNFLPFEVRVGMWNMGFSIGQSCG